MRQVRWFLAVGILLALPGIGFAQEATLTGAITDTTGGVLPGVTVSAVLEATGNRFDTVTDETGRFRIPARIGAYSDLSRTGRVLDGDSFRRAVAGVG